MLNSKRLYIYKLVTQFLPESRCYGLKNALLRWCGAKIGDRVRIYSSTQITGTGGLEIGDDVFVGPRTMICSNGDATIRVESQVNIGAMSYIVTGTHLIDSTGERTCGEGFNRDVVIKKGAWLTVHIFVLPGVMEDCIEIGEKAMVMAGSVVTSSVPERAVVQGSPAAQIGSLPRRCHRSRHCSASEGEKR